MAHSLRKRVVGDASGREESPAKAEEVRLAPVSKIKSGKDADHKKYRKRRNGFIFGLGGVFGIVIAGLFAKRSDLSFPELGDLSMDSILDVLPAAFVRDARDLAVCLLSSLTLGAE